MSSSCCPQGSLSPLLVPRRKCGTGCDADSADAGKAEPSAQAEGEGGSGDGGGGSGPLGVRRAGPGTAGRRREAGVDGYGEG